MDTIKYYKWPYLFEVVNDIDKFLEKYDLSKLTQEVIENLNVSIIIK